MAITASQQLANESAMISSGNKAGAIASSAAYNAPTPTGGPSQAQQNIASDVPAVVTAGPAKADVTSKMAHVNDLASTQNSSTWNGTAVNPKQPQSLMNGAPNPNYVFPTPSGTTEAPPPTPVPTTPPAPVDTSGTTGMAGGTTGTGTGTPDVPSLTQAANDNIASAKTASDAANARAESAYASYQESLTQLQNGTFPLTPNQQAQIDSITQRFQSLIATQKVANANYTGAITQAGISAGRNMYAPEVELGNVNAAINTGIAKIADLNVKMSDAITTAKSAFETQDLTLLNASYNALTKIIDDRKKTSDDMYNRTKDALDAAQREYEDKAAAAKIAFDEQQVLNQPLIDANKQAKDYLYTEMQKYPDAGITAADTVQQAVDKIKASASYQAEQNKESADLAAKKASTEASKASAASSYASAASSYASAAKTRAEIAAIGSESSTDKVQQKLEQEYRSVLVKEVNSRSGSLGTEDAKVVQANHLASLLNQYYDPKTGNYNVPKAQYGELVLGLAGLLSKTGTPTDSQVENINTKTATGDLNAAITYVTGNPTNGSTDAVIKNLADSISRQATTAVSNRDYAVKRLEGLAPTDLDANRRAALEKNTLAPYAGIHGIDAPQSTTQSFTGKLSDSDVASAKADGWTITKNADGTYTTTK